MGVLAPSVTMIRIWPGSTEASSRFEESVGEVFLELLEVASVFSSYEDSKRLDAREGLWDEESSAQLSGDVISPLSDRS